MNEKKEGVYVYIFGCKNRVLDTNVFNSVENLKHFLASTNKHSRLKKDALQIINLAKFEQVSASDLETKCYIEISKVDINNMDESGLYIEE
jgi:hypothetical protein